LAEAIIAWHKQLWHTVYSTVTDGSQMKPLHSVFVWSRSQTEHDNDWNRFLSANNYTIRVQTPTRNSRDTILSWSTEERNVASSLLLFPT